MQFGKRKHPVFNNLKCEAPFWAWNGQINVTVLTDTTFEIIQFWYNSTEIDGLVYIVLIWTIS